MITNNIKMAIIVKGSNIREYVSPMNFQTYVEGRDGSEFEIELSNDSNRDIEAIVSVDGLSIIDGKPAGSKSMGYIISAKSSVKIPGWKLQGNSSAAKFVFSGKQGGSYAEQSGQGRSNLGVIGLMAFSRKIPMANFSNASYKNLYPKGVRGFGVSASASSGSSSNNMLMGFADEPALGTGFGEETKFETKSDTFERDDMVAMMELFYTDRQGLKRVGIDVAAMHSTRPSAFPADSSVGCIPPQNWR